MALSHLTALVVGQGSIGQRHARILREDCVRVATVSAHQEGSFHSIEDAFAANAYDYVVVANPTSQHLDAMLALKKLSFGGDLLVEKPLAASRPELPESAPFRRVGVAYNLRFHPVIAALRAGLRGATAIEVRIHVGQYLPDWRPNSDFRQQSSAKLGLGGGVLRDLSHEIDLLLHLFGPWRRLTALGGNRGVLGIETDETWSVLLELESGAHVSLTLNYLDRTVARHITVNTADDTWRADLIAGTLASKETTNRFEVARDDTYRAQHQAMLGPDASTVCTIAEAVEVMDVIAAIERAASERCWIAR